jgi:hypothetical protein
MNKIVKGKATAYAEYLHQNGLSKAIPYAKFLCQNGFSDIRFINQTTYVAILKFLFTAAIVKGTIGDTIGYNDRWCYHSVEDARKALTEWDPLTQQEPAGWHRHPTTGRRREEGNPASEYFAP